MKGIYSPNDSIGKEQTISKRKTHRKTIKNPTTSRDSYDERWDSSKTLRIFIPCVRHNIAITKLILLLLNPHNLRQIILRLIQPLPGGQLIPFYRFLLISSDTFTTITHHTDKQIKHKLISKKFQEIKSLKKSLKIQV